MAPELMGRGGGPGRLGKEEIVLGLKRRRRRSLWDFVIGLGICFILEVLLIINRSKTYHRLRLDGRKVGEGGKGNRGRAWCPIS
jgi:hypothetical protein